MHSETNFKDLKIFKSKSKEYTFICRVYAGASISIFLFFFYFLARLQAPRALIFVFSQGGALEIDLKALENEAKS